MIRAAETSDFDVMDAVFRASAKALCVGAYDVDTVAAWAGDPWPDRFIRSVEEGNQQYVLEIDNRVVCFGAIHIEQQRLVSLFVDPAYAGKGLGQSMFDYLLAQAKSAGVSELQLDSSLNAVTFYARNGFVEQSRGQFSTQGGVVLGSVQMSRTL